MSRIRVFLAEDHETVRQGLRLLISEQNDMEVAGEASDGRLAIDRVAALKPTVAVLDLSMPNMGGLEATRGIRQATPGTAVVALTRHADEAYVRELLQAGASGYVLKQSASIELLKAIRAAARGDQYVDAALSTISGATALPHRRQARQGPWITGRETEVLKLMALGHSNKDIANSLDIAVKTVEVHKANGMRKLGLRGRTDIVRFAMLKGWLKEP